MKKVYIQPEIELLTVSALDDFLINSPSQDEVVEDNNKEGANDSWLEAGDSDGNGYAGNEWD